MPKFGKWKEVGGEKKISMWMILHLSRSEIINMISHMLEKNSMPNNKTEIMNEAYAKMNLKDVSVFQNNFKDKMDLASSIFDKYFSDYGDKDELDK